jgi:hypothetical protein
VQGFEYALILLSVLVGLGLSDVAASLHKLLGLGRSVRWDGRVIISTALVVETTVRMWFDVWTIRNVSFVLTFGFYLSLVIEFMLLFLLASACLPDEPSGNCDLGPFYDANSRRFWLLFTLFLTSYFGHWLLFTEFRAPPIEWFITLSPLALAIVLAAFRFRPLHYAVPLAMLVLDLALSWRRQFG